MAQATIDNPIINSPYLEPARHFLTSSDGTVTGEIDDRRRPSEFFVPVAPPKKRSGQLTLDQFGGPKRQQPNEIVNEIRQSVERWRRTGYPHFTATTRDLLAHWTDDDRERRLFFLRADISDEAWATVNSNVSRPFPRPTTGKIAVKVINHYGDEVMKVFGAG